MGERRVEGFTLVEVIMALGFTALLVLVAISLTFTSDNAHTSISDRIEAEHSGQATLEYLVRELQTATAFYVSEAKADSICYRKGSSESTYTYWRLSINHSDHRLYRYQYLSNDFGTPSQTVVISDGINFLDLTYFAAHAGTTVEIPAGTLDDSGMFFMIQTEFSVTVGKSTVHLGSAVSTLNIKGEWSYPANPDEVI